MEAVLDTNVVVSALISPKGPPAEIIRAWRAHSFTCVTSPALLDELERVLPYPRIKPYLIWTDDELMELLELIRLQTKVVTPSQALDVIEDDPDDNRVLQAAVEGRAGYIVSGDRHLLGLGKYAHIAIVTPARFAAIIATGLG